MREIRRRLGELKKENEELRNLLSITGKNQQEYETKVKSSSPAQPPILICLLP